MICANRRPCSRFQIVLQNKLELYITFIDSAGSEFFLLDLFLNGLHADDFRCILVALITGAIYLLLPTTSAGAFTRGGVLFISVLYNAFHAFNEIPTTMLGRPIMWKHHSFTFYRPAALSIASTIAGAPISALQIFVFCIIVYFMTGLYSSAAAFFIVSLIPTVKLDSRLTSLSFNSSISQFYQDISLFQLFSDFLVQYVVVLILLEEFQL